MSREPTILVCHVIVGLGVGGAELMLKRLIDAHRHHPTWRHSVVSLTSIGTIGADLRASGIDVHALGIKSFINAAPGLLRLIRLLRKQRPDIVQTWMYHADFLGGLAARLAGCANVIWGVRTTDVAAGGSRATIFLRSLCAMMSGWAPRIIACAAEAARHVHVAAGYCASRVVVIPNGFDLNRFPPKSNSSPPLRIECGFAPEDVVVGTLGRFNAAKDQQNFVRAAVLLAPQFPAARFLMVGRDCDANNGQLMDWISSAGFSERFVLLGERNDAPSCLAAMDVFCLSSRTEGFPNVVGEAMATALPCVVTDVGDAAFLVGTTGVVVPKEDSAALAKGMAHMLSMSVEARTAIGRAARERIVQEFSMERCTQRYEALYTNVLNTLRE